MATECVNPSDCPNDGIVRHCYTEIDNKREAFCDCFFYFGFTGESCDIPTSTVNYIRVSSFLTITWSYILLILTSRTLFFNIRLGYNPEKGIDPVNYALFWVICGCLSLLLFSILQITSNFNQNYTIYLSDNEERIGPIGGIIEQFALQIFYFCTIISVWAIMLSWQKVIEKVELFVRNGSKVLNYKLTIWFYRLVFVLLFALCCFNKLFAAVIINTLTGLITAVLFFIYGKNFKKLLVKLDQSQSKGITLTLYVIKRLIYLTLIVVLCFPIALIGFSITSNNLNKTANSGDFNISLFFVDLSNFSGLLLLSSYSWYANSVTEGVVLTDLYKCCKIFYCWDAGNRKMFPENDSKALQQANIYQNQIEVDEENEEGQPVTTAYESQS